MRGAEAVVAEAVSGEVMEARTGMAPVMPPTGEVMPEGPGAWRSMSRRWPTR